MINLPEGFDAAILFSELFGAAVPFVGVAVLIASGFLVLRVIRRC